MSNRATLKSSKIRTFRRSAVVALTVAAGSIAMAGAASAAPSPGAGVYNGNQCSGARWYVDNAGAEACVFQNAASAGSWVSLSAGAFDYARDGYSAKTDVNIQQYRYGAWGSTDNLYAVINSSGYGTTRVGGGYTVSRQAGASHFRLLIRACTYDSPTTIHKSCGSRYTGAIAW